MTRILKLIVFNSIFIVSTAVNAQSENWYLLKSIPTITEEECKATIVAIQQISPELNCWFNGSKTSTFGCKSVEGIPWSDIIPILNNSGFFIADVSTGENHQSGNRAATSIFYQRAYYYFMFPKERPIGFIAKLNEDEWNALPEEAQAAYIENHNYYIIQE